ITLLMLLCRIVFPFLINGILSEIIIVNFLSQVAMCTKIDGVEKWIGLKNIGAEQKFMGKVFIPVVGNFLEITSYPLMKSYFFSLASMVIIKIVPMGISHIWLIKK